LQLTLIKFLRLSIFDKLFGLFVFFAKIENFEPATVPEIIFIDQREKVDQKL
jgi:hypothetical protein